MKSKFSPASARTFQPRRSVFRKFHFAGWLVVWSAAAPAFAATYIWNGGGADNDWGTAENWQGGAAAVSNTATDLQFAGTTRPAPNANAAYTVKSITFNAGAGAFTLTGASLTLSTGSVTNNSTSFQSIANSGVVLSGASTWNAASGDMAVSSVISGSGSLTKTGTGALTLSGGNTYTGATIVSGGTLRNGGNGALASAAVVTVSGTTAGVNATWDLDGYNQTIGSLALGSTAGRANVVNTVATGSGTLTLGGNVSYVNSSTSANHAAGAVITGKLDLGGATRTFTVANSSKAATDLTISATISGTGGLTATGAGTLQLSGTNTYTGATTITNATVAVTKLADGGTASGIGLSGSAATNLTLTNGTLRYIGTGDTTGRLFQIGNGSGTVATIDASGAADATHDGAVVFSNTGAMGFAGTANQARTLELAGTNTAGNTMAASITNNGSGATSIFKTGSGRWIISGANTFTGNVLVGGGILSVASNTALGAVTPSASANTVVAAVATLEFNNVNIGAEAISIRGSGVGGVGALSSIGTSSYSGRILLENDATIGVEGSFLMTGTIAAPYSNMAVTKTGTGTLTLGGADQTSQLNYVVNAGTLVMDKATGWAATGNSVIVNNSGTVRLASGNGDQIIYTAAVQVNTGGTLDLNGRNEGIRSLQGGGAVTNTAAGASTITVGNTDFNASSSFSGNVQDGAGRVNLVKDGTGTFTLSGRNTYTGTTTVLRGTLIINGDHSDATGGVLVAGTLGGAGIISGATTIQNGGTLSPGNSPGVITFEDSLTIEVGATVLIEAGDRVDVGGLLTLEDAWTLAITGDFQDGGSTVLFTYGSLDWSGAAPDFDVSGLGFTPSGPLFLTDTGSSIVLSGVSQIPEPASMVLLGGAGMVFVTLRRRGSTRSPDQRLLGFGYDAAFSGFSAPTGRHKPARGQRPGYGGR